MHTNATSCHMHHKFLSSCQCDASEATWQLIKVVLEEDGVDPPPRIMFLGGGCSLATEPLAALAGRFYNVTQVSLNIFKCEQVYWKIISLLFHAFPQMSLNTNKSALPATILCLKHEHIMQPNMNVHVLWCTLQVSYGASTPTLSDRTMYPTFFRLIPSEIQSNSARLALMKHYNWIRIAILHETRNLFRMVRTCTVCIVEREKEREIERERERKRKRGSGGSGKGEKEEGKAS